MCMVWYGGFGVGSRRHCVAELLQQRSKVPVCTVHAVIKMDMCWGA
jgi:hypothetical protein